MNCDDPFFDGNELAHLYTNHYIFFSIVKCQSDGVSLIFLESTRPESKNVHDLFLSHGLNCFGLG